MKVGQSLAGNRADNRLPALFVFAKTLLSIYGARILNSFRDPSRGENVRGTYFGLTELKKFTVSFDTILKRIYSN